MPVFVDQIKREVEIPAFPKKIISLVPSITELLSDLGLERETIGITRFCIHPAAWHKNKKRVGGTKDPDIALIRAMNPDLIIASKEENRKEDIEELALEFPVWVADISNLEEANAMIFSIAAISNRQAEGTRLVAKINAGFERLQAFRAKAPLPTFRKTAYLIWKNPYIAAGSGTFIHDMMHRCGFGNFFEDIPRYPIFDLDSLHRSGCDLVLLSSEPYPFREKHRMEIKADLPNARIQLVDGSYFSWYGSRLVESPRYFEQLLLMPD